MPDFERLIGALMAHYGSPTPQPAKGPFELVLWENACYLLPDDRRAAVFEGLRQQVGLTPAAIMNADQAVLLTLAKMGGMRPETRVFRWTEIARITLSQFGGDLDRILALPYAQAKRALKQFPTIGDPGAEKILLFCGMGSGLPLDWNGLRVLTRIGYGRAEKSYARHYRSVQDALAGELPSEPEALAQAHLLLRRHGKELCRDKAPLCSDCPVSPMCAYPIQPAV